MRKPNPYLIDEDNPELTDEFFKHAVPARLIHPDWVEDSERRKRRERGQKEPVKQLISRRVDKDVLATFKATGSGWKSRMVAALHIAAKRLQPFTPEATKQKSVPSRKRSVRSK